MSIDKLADTLIERIGRNLEKMRSERAMSQMVEEAKQVMDAVETIETHKSAGENLLPAPNATPPKDITNIRRAVCTFANAIKKLSAFGCSLSNAFKKAWATVKAKTIHTSIGCSAGKPSEYQIRLHQLQSYHPTRIAVELRREVNKIFEMELELKSVAVWISVDGDYAYKLGYIKKNMGRYIAKLLDNGVKLAAKWHNVDGGSLSNLTRTAKIDINVLGFDSPV